jgi:hypothetical protein
MERLIAEEQEMDQMMQRDSSRCRGNSTPGATNRFRRQLPLQDDFRSAGQTEALLTTATLIVEIAAVMSPLLVHLMDGDGTFGTPRRQNGDVGEKKVTMWPVSLTWMNTSSLLLLMVRT